jgi:hypothetical protein
MLVGTMGSTGSLASPLRPLAAEKSTKKLFDFLKI